MRRTAGSTHIVLILTTLLLAWTGAAAALNIAPPAEPVKLIFIHHSTGGNWLADETPAASSGGLGTALMNNNYFVSATNYDWGPGQIGSSTDIIHWPDWFHNTTVMTAVYTESGQTLYTPGDWRYFGDWTRMAADPGGENEIILFKSCFPNSDLYGNPDDPANEPPNDWEYSVSNAKAVYNDIRTYFATRTDKLFIVITAPPLMKSDTTWERAANARGFNNWLVHEWLQDYPHANVGVFDYFNVLTDPNNHHRIADGHVDHTAGFGTDFAYYLSGDSHPSSAGHRKATAEFIPLLNYFYHRWKEGGTVVTGNIDGSSDGEVTLADAILALQICAGLSPAGAVSAAAVNPDGRIGLADAIFALQTAADLRDRTGSRVQSTDLEYLGAFRLPDAFNWGARGMSFYPDGDGGAGSLLITGSEALRTPDGTACYEGLTDCAAYFAEVAVPTPAQESDWAALPRAAFLTPPTIFDGGLAQTVHSADAFVTGIQYMYRQGAQLTDKIYGSLNEWYPEGDYGDASFPTIWFSNLDGSNARGVFHVGPAANPLYHGRKMGDFLFSVPDWYADAYLGGRTLVTGRSRGTPVGDTPELTTSGGSQGPTLFAFQPLATDDPGDATELDAFPILYYRVKYPGCAGPDIGLEGSPVDCDFPYFTMCDSWDGGSFIGTREKNAVVLLGRKGATNCYYCNDTGVDPQCPFSAPVAECSRYCNESQGYHCGPYRREFLFYDTARLADAALGRISPWEVLPYEVWEPTRFFLTGPDVCGGVGGLAYDETGRRLFAIEKGLGGYQGENAAVVHVWQVN